MFSVSIFGGDNTQIHENKIFKKEWIYIYINKKEMKSNPIIFTPLFMGFVVEKSKLKLEIKVK